MILSQRAKVDIQRCDEWLDRAVDQRYKDQPLAQDWARISKIGEELGEAIQAFIGATGQNPRKGVTNSLTEVVNELADVVFTSLLAIQHITKNSNLTDRILWDRLERISSRVSADA